jgi:hypothetical protein
MKTRMLLPLLAAIATASPAVAEPCSTVASRYTIARTLRLAAEERPVNVHFQTSAEGVKIPDGLKSKYGRDDHHPPASIQTAQRKGRRLSGRAMVQGLSGTAHRTVRCDQVVLGPE